MNNIQHILDAYKKGDLDEVKNHIEKGVDIDAKDINGRTPLIEACWYEKIEVVKFLVEKGADIEAKDNFGNTPLIEASCNGEIEIVKFLIEKGADTEAKNINGHTFYSYIGTCSKKEIDLLLKNIEKRKMMIKSCKRYHSGV